MPPKKTIIIKKPATVAKPTEPISVFVERAEQPPRLSTRKLGDPTPPAQATPTETKPGLPATFKFYCYRCGQKLQAETAWAGKEVTCTTCGRTIVIPPPLTE